MPAGAAAANHAARAHRAGRLMARGEGSSRPVRKPEAFSMRAGEEGEEVSRPPVAAGHTAGVLTRLVPSPKFAHERVQNARAGDRRPSGGTVAHKSLPRPQGRKRRRVRRPQCWATCVQLQKTAKRRAVPQTCANERLRITVESGWMIVKTHEPAQPAHERFAQLPRVLSNRSTDE